MSEIGEQRWRRRGGIKDLGWRRRQGLLRMRALIALGEESECVDLVDEV